MATKSVKNPFSGLKNLVILPEFLDKKERGYKKLQSYILDKSVNEVRLKTEDIQSVIANSPYEPYQKSFHVYFFESILGENTVLKNAKNFYAPNEKMINWRYGWYYDHINTFFSTFTNMASVAQSFMEMVRLLPEKDVIVVKDRKLANLYYCYFIYLRIKGYSVAEITKKFVIFDGSVLVIEPDVSVREIQLQYRWIIMLHPNLNKWINPVFLRDVEEMCEHYSEAQRGFDIKCM